MAKYNIKQKPVEEVKNVKNLKLQWSPMDQSLDILSETLSDLRNDFKFITEYSQDINHLTKFYSSLYTYWSLLRPLCGKYWLKEIDSKFNRLKIIFNREFKVIPIQIHDKFIELYNQILELSMRKGCLYNVQTAQGSTYGRYKQKIIS